MCCWILLLLTAAATVPAAGKTKLPPYFEEAIRNPREFLPDALPAIVTRDQMLRILENFTLLMAAMAPRGPQGPPGPKGDPGHCVCNEAENAIMEMYSSSQKTLQQKDGASRKTKHKRFGPKSKQLKNKPGKKPISNINKNKAAKSTSYPKELQSVVDITRKLKKMLKKSSSSSSGNDDIIV